MSMPTTSSEHDRQPCPHENITTTLIVYQGEVISASTLCDDCTTTLTDN
jgi:hypothetical protein